MDNTRFADLILQDFPYEPTGSQQSLIQSLSSFIISKEERGLFVLKGYAGTGKTTVISTFVKNLPSAGLDSVLLAPTGRAAKVLSAYSGKKAFTIHKKIYFLATAIDGTTKLILGGNKHKNTIFMVDEASMIPDDSVASDFSLFSSRNLLDDLITYVYSGEKCRLVLIGDSAQLPPVGIEESPALNLDYLKSAYHLAVQTCELKEVVRQSLESGILANATVIRKNILLNNPVIRIEMKDFTDLIRLSGTELEDALNEAFSGSGLQETVIITRSNKRANIFNQEIRKRILFLENEISTGDYLMIVKNNYFWIGKDSKPGFLANGDIVEIVRIEKFEEMFGFRFANVVIRLTDYPDENDLSVKIMLDTLMLDGPSLPAAANRRLFEEVLKDYDDIPSRRAKIEKAKNNPYYNALQVKFAYSLTCHKTQGGQWERVFIDQGFIAEKQVNREYLRWLYTAFTRATGSLYLVNFHESFFA
jgi:exodeoxyribonuclease-5